MIHLGSEALKVPFARRLECIALIAYMHGADSQKQVASLNGRTIGVLMADSLPHLSCRLAETTFSDGAAWVDFSVTFPGVPSCLIARHHWQAKIK